MQRIGLHVECRGKASIPAAERLITELAPQLGFNWIILEINGGFAYASHPEAAEPDPMEVSDARRLAGLARARDLHLVPMYNCLGHQSWKEHVGALLRSHPEFDEAPEIDPKSEGFYCKSWCPNHPQLSPLLFDLFDELLDAFDAAAFHVGMDEVFIVGHCPRCRGAANAELFAKAVNDYHSHLVGKRGVELQMWGDRLLDSAATGYHEWEASRNDTHQAIDLIPTDIVMCDWHYEIMDDFPSVRLFQDKGFRVWPAGWNKEQSIRRFVEVARREAGPNMLGYLATTWTSLPALVAGLAGEPMEADSKGLPDITAGVKLGAELAQG